MNERTNARANKRMHKRTNARMYERTDARTNENTGLHPVLGYFAPSGLDGLMNNGDNLATNARMPG
jgi:hypothetical protein